MTLRRMEEVRPIPPEKMGLMGPCAPGDGGLLLPIFADENEEWNDQMRAVLYLIGLLWCFMGVAIVADVFMAAIEQITSKKKRVQIKGTDRFVTIKVWNDTIANLTLMALGSSAPEILLSVIEIVTSTPSFFSGALGPSTIVGSAAFNLLCISAVCVIAIPNGETRIIKDTSVFAVTAFFSVFAYIWLIIILQVSSPDVVEPWEGIVSFLMFPLLVVLAFAADKGIISGAGTRADTLTSRVVAA